MRRHWLPDDDRWSPDWPAVREELNEMGPYFAHEVAIIDSIILSSVADQLVFKTSMHDLWIASAPIRPGPTEFIHVMAPNSIGHPSPRNGYVRIQHRTASGRNDNIERPISESVPLFWRFASEKFGVVADRAAGI